MGKATHFESPAILVGTNAFEPGQEHAAHSHAGADKIYYVLEGTGEFAVGDSRFTMGAGQMVAAPAGVEHSVKNPGPGRLLVMAIIAPAPGGGRK
jgi:mannose-6-phosphate isomerase-like protein (cupin superfamily)